VWADVTSRTARPARLAAAVLATAALLAACGGGDGDEDRRDPVAATGTPSAQALPPAPPPPPAPAPVDPLTGQGPAPTSPLVAVKIDNGILARPFQRGLEGASVVYVELVEGGTTRFLGLYSQAPDLEVGPIRSLRESDMELLLQHGKVGVGFSGANDLVLRGFREAATRGEFVDIGYETRPELYRIGERRKDAKNFFANAGNLARNSTNGTAAKDAGLRFGDGPRPDTTPGTAARVTFSKQEGFAVQYDPASQRYSVSVAGRAVAGASPANVVVQQVQVRDGGFVDVVGNRTPYVVTVGSGTVDVLRDGVRQTGTWQRPDALSGTRFVAPDGTDLPLKPGPTWILLQPAGSALSIR
jgi:hypothetical protein